MRSVLRNSILVSICELLLLESWDLDQYSLTILKKWCIGIQLGVFSISPETVIPDLRIECAWSHLLKLFYLSANPDMMLPAFLLALSLS
jgi:hypothetical protein